MITESDFVRVKNDVNGNPRYVCHFVNLLTAADKVLPLAEKYSAALFNAKKLHGRKFHNRQFGGGIVFTTYNLPRLCNDIAALTGNAQ